MAMRSSAFMDSGNEARTAKLRSAFIKLLSVTRAQGVGNNLRALTLASRDDDADRG
jgi:hypothetical protein